MATEEVNVTPFFTIKGELSSGVKASINLNKANEKLRRIRRTERGRKYLKRAKAHTRMKNAREQLINKIIDETKERERANRIHDEHLNKEELLERVQFEYIWHEEIEPKWDFEHDRIKNSGFIDKPAVDNYIKAVYPNDWNDKTARQLQNQAEFDNLKDIRDKWLLS